MTNNFMYTTGVVEGTPEYLYRVVRLNAAEVSRSAWYGPGDFLFSAGGLVADHFPRLQAGDIVEYRQPEIRFDALLDFSRTGEGTIVTKILCRKAQPDFDACLATLPRLGRHPGLGPTGRPFPPSVKDYGFTFTPMYDATGKQLRPFPPVQ